MGYKVAPHFPTILLDSAHCVQRCAFMNTSLHTMGPAAHVKMLLAAVLWFAVAACSSADRPPQIAAAADLRLALVQVANSFEAETGLQVELNFGSSGNFSRQLMQAAPFEMFLSADEAYVTNLAEAGKTDGSGHLYAIGRLAMVAPIGSPINPDAQMSGLRKALAAGSITRFAIANPEHAPYGQKAQEALEHQGLWNALQGRLVMGENVAQAMQFAIEGGAQGGIVAYALVLDPAVAARANYVLLPAEWHQPLRQRMVLMQGASDTARKFYAYLQQPKARAILAQYGFTLPQEGG